MIFETILIFFTALIAALLSSMSGGGASIITLPIFLSLGMSFPLATATQKVSSVFWVVPAAYNYLKNQRIEWRFLALFTSIGLVGAYFGFEAVISLDEKLLERMIGGLILTMVAYIYFQKDIGLKSKVIQSKLRKWAVYPFALLLGFYESLFGSGNGIAFAILGSHTRGFDFINALGYYFASAFFWTAFASFLFIRGGYFDIKIALPAILGSILGSYLGSKYAKHKGNQFIKNIFVFIGGVLGVKLLFGL
jgi:uncharacterized membrane protein YfcA